MTYAIITDEHPLDGVWAQAIQALSDAEQAMEALGSDFEDHQLNAAGAVLHAARIVIWSLPARHFSDTLYKLTIADVERDVDIAGCDITAIINEGTTLLDAGIARGAKLRKALPDLVEGVQS